MEVVPPVVASSANAIAKPFVDVFQEKLDYLIRSKKYMEEMSTRVHDLVPVRDRVQQEVTKAERFGQVIRPEVRRWLSSINAIIEKEEALSTGRQRCLNGWCVNLCSRYKANKGAHKIIKRLQLLPQAPPSVALPPPAPTIPPSDPDVMEFESTKLTMRLIMEALQDENCNIIGIVGMGGVGKTTIVALISDKIKANGQFDLVVMAVVSQTPDDKRIQDQIATMLNLTLSANADKLGRASQLQDRISNIKRILVILDDVWKKLDLNNVGIPIHHKGCKILLTTRKADVCTVMGVRRENQIHVKVLSENESWELFRKGAGDMIDTPEFKKIADEVMGKCKGLPIALLTVGRALRDQDLREWKTAKLQLRNSTPTLVEGVSKEVYSCLKLSYDYLEGETTKLCFLLCCLFPEDYDIDIEVILRYAKQKIPLIESLNTIENARTIVVSTIKKLRGCCLLEEGRRRDCVKMHDVVRDVAKSIASGDANRYLICTGCRLKEWPTDIPIEDYTAISFMSNDIRELSGAPDAAKLEILSLAENYEISSIEVRFFERMKALRVLDLTSIPSHDQNPLDVSSLQYLTQLRSLMLDCWLPNNISVIGKLKTLEILSLRGSTIEELPVEIGELSRLRLLDLTSCYRLKTVPANVISRLHRLEELYMMRWLRSSEVDGEERRSTSLSEIQSLTQLARVSLDSVDVGLLANFALPKTVTYFAFKLGAGGHALDENFAKFCNPEARYLSVRSTIDLDGLKKWLRLANTLKLDHLYLRNVKLDRGSGHSSEMIKVIVTDADESGGLNCLKSLEVDNIECIKALTSPVPIVVLANLQQLKLVCLESMIKLGMGGGLSHASSLRNLRILTIRSCGMQGPAVSSSWVQRLHNLEKVSLSSCDDVTEVFEITETNGEIEEEGPPSSLLPSLKEMWLVKMPGLESIWNGNVNFPTNLTHVRISLCANLVSIFPLGISGSLSNLETLLVFKCENVEVIFQESESEGIIQSIKLPSPKSLSVSHCRKLKSLFSVSTAQASPKLEIFQVRSNRQLEQIISCNGNGAVDAKINWPHLSTMRLIEMQELKRICPENCSVDLPHLKTLDFEKCDTMENFASDTTAYGLHIPQSVNPEVDQLRPIEYSPRYRC